MAQGLHPAEPVTFQPSKEVLVHYRRLMIAALAGLLAAASLTAPLAADDPPPINPFGPRSAERADARPGYAELSDGTILPGQISLTQDARLKIYDRQARRLREVPLRAVQQLQCEVEEEWLEREWRFKENANNEKVYTGRRYPARKYVHTIALANGSQIQGDLSGILYVRMSGRGKPIRLLMHKRDKGPVGAGLESLVYLRRVELGDQALLDGLRRQARQPAAQRPPAAGGGPQPE